MKIVSIVILVVIGLIGGVVKSENVCMFRYAFIIDAGSSGTRFHVFKFDTSTSRPKLKMTKYKKGKGGIATFKDKPKNQEEMKKMLKLGTRAVLKYIPNECRESTIYRLQATAGVRALFYLK